MLDAILDAIDAVTGAHNAPKQRTKPATTFYVTAPLCIPVRHVYDELYRVGICGKWTPAIDVFNAQAARLTVSAKQTQYAGELLWTLAAIWPEGLNIRGDPKERENKAAVARRGYKMPKPWKDNGKEWRQQGCKKPR